MYYPGFVRQVKVFLLFVHRMEALPRDRSETKDSASAPPRGIVQGRRGDGWRFVVGATFIGAMGMGSAEQAA